MSNEDKRINNLTVPGKPMKKEEFISLIKEAEQGEFMSLDEFDQKFNEWRLNRKQK